MLSIKVPVVIVLYGAVHLWYALLMAKIVKLIPEMGWTGKSGLLTAEPVEGIYRCCEEYPGAGYQAALTHGAGKKLHGSPVA